ncbi:copper resistance CopC family protein [Blastococcus aurantiacus]|uniref:copper resistance CopC family protein n=1 Tax=Blastococcus aurantiacus TaxID=1550231 RepID=UPI00159FE181|nr:copper resistance protein CopC [Blastococcus aurantiacus]
MTSRRASGGQGIRRASSVLAPAVAACALVLGLPSSALAHDGLVGTSPADGTTVTGAPGVVELEFTGEPLPLGTLVAVTGPDGASVSSGSADISGATVTQAVAPDAPPGAYRVEWRSTSSDGHPLSGTFDFAVTAGADPAATGPEPSAEAVELAATATAADEGMSLVWPAAGAVVLVGLVAVVVTRLRRRG